MSPNWSEHMEMVTRKLLLTECTIWREDGLFFVFFLFFSFFLQGLEILAVSGSYFVFKIILSLFLVIGWGRGWEGSCFGGLLKLGGDVVMLAPAGRDQRSCHFRSLEDRTGVGVMRERGREK